MHWCVGELSDFADCEPPGFSRQPRRDFPSKRHPVASIDASGEQ